MKKPFAAAVCCALLFCSCIGTSSNISIRADGSGTLTLEYRMAKTLEELGKLDGNERWLPVPAGRADLERSVQRIEGLKLVSYAQKTEGDDTVLTARLSFAAPGAFTAFFDASGQLAELDMAKRRLVFTFAGGDRLSRRAGNELSAEFRGLAEESLSGYSFSLAVNFPAAVSLRWLDETGGETRSPGASSVEGTSLRFTAPMAELALLEKTLVMEASW